MRLIKRDVAFFEGYWDYCREAYQNKVKYFVPSNPDKLDDGWFERTKPWLR